MSKKRTRKKRQNIPEKDLVKGGKVISEEVLAEERKNIPVEFFEEVGKAPSWIQKAKELTLDTDVDKIFTDEKLDTAKLSIIFSNYYDKCKSADSINGLNKIFSHYLSSYPTKSQIKYIHDPDLGIKLLDGAAKLSNLIFRNLFYRHLQLNNTQRTDFNKNEDQINWENRRFDSLSRLIALDSQCSAACYDSNSKKILIAFNEVHTACTAKRKEKYTQHTEKVFQYINNCLEKKYINDEEARIFDRNKILVAACRPYLDKKSFYTDDYILSKVNHLDLLEPSERNNNSRNEVPTVIRRLYRDIEKLTDATYRGEKKFNQDIRNALKEHKIIESGYANDKFHAEMRIVKHLIDNKLEGEIYIGLSKLCCAHCNLIIRGNDLTLKIDDQEYTFSTRGYHGRSFEWTCAKAFAKEPALMTKLMGNDAYKIFEKTPDDFKINLLEDIEKIGSEPAKNFLKLGITAEKALSRKGQIQLPYDSDSDEENFVDKEKIAQSDIKKSLQNFLKKLEGVKDLDEENIDLFRQVKEKVKEIQASKIINEQPAHKELESPIPRSSAPPTPIAALSSEKPPKPVNISPPRQQTGKRNSSFSPTASREAKRQKKNDDKNLSPISAPSFAFSSQENSPFKTESRNSPSPKKLCTSTKKPTKRHKVGEKCRHSSNHLKEAGKSMLSGDNGAYDFSKSLSTVNSNQQLLKRLEIKAVIETSIVTKYIDTLPDVRQDNNKSIKGEVQVISEDNHIKRHGANIRAITDRIKNGEINSNTVIALELKQYGENLGMKDVTMLANIISHNEKYTKYLDKQITIPPEITKDTLIYQDAILYKAAKENGVKVIGLEGRNLEATKSDIKYNQNREEYMANVIHELNSKGYNVIANVGSSHTENIQRLLNRKMRQDEPSVGYSKIPRHLQEQAYEIKTSAVNKVQASISAHLSPPDLNSTSSVITQKINMIAKKHKNINFTQR